MIGEQLYLEKEPGNPHDNFAVAIINDYQVVGHIPEDFSWTTWHFITRGGSVMCQITGRRKKRKGPEVPCKYIFRGSTKDVKKLKKLLAYANTS